MARLLDALKNKLKQTLDQTTLDEQVRGKVGQLLGGSKQALLSLQPWNNPQSARMETKPLTLGQKFWLSGAGQTLAGQKSIPKVNLSQSKPVQEIKNPVLRFAAQAPLSVAESFANIPSNLSQGVVNTGSYMGQAVRGTTPLTPYKVAANAAPFGVGMLDLATSGLGTTALAKKGLEAVGKQGLKQVVKQGAKAGAAYGGAQGLLNELGNQRDRQDIAKLGTATYTGIAGGTLLGGAMGGAGKLLNQRLIKIVSRNEPKLTQAQAQNKVNRFIQDTVTGRMKGSIRLKKEPKYYGDMREAVGASRNGDGPNFGLRTSVKGGSQAIFDAELSTRAVESKPREVIRLKTAQRQAGASPSSEAQQLPSPLLQTPQTPGTGKPSVEPAYETIIADAKKSIGKSSEPKGRSISQMASDLYTQWVDRYNPITKATDTAKKQLKLKGAELRPEFDPTYQVRRLTGAGGIADYRFRTELEPVIKEMDNLKIDKADMDVYLANKRMAGFDKAGREVYGADPVKSAQVVSAIEAKYGENIKNLADKLYAYQDAGFDEMVRAGFISPETAATIRSQNPDYAPLQRVMDEVDNYLGVPTRKTMQGSQPVVKLKGSKRQIESPLENIIANTFKQRAAIEKNNVAKSIAGLQSVADVGFKRVAEAGNDTITVWNNGTKEYWQVGEEIANVAKGLNEENMNALLKIFTVPASLLRQGATGRNPEFMLPNIIRDQLDAAITSKYGYIPFIDYLSGLKSMIGNDEIYQKWQVSGAKIDLGEMAGRKNISAYFDEKTGRKGLFSWLGGALDTMGKYSEQPTRVGLFKKAYQKTGNQTLAMMESRDATVDFARMGSKMKVANSIVPFLNVGVQGFDKLIRSVKNNPGKVLLNASIYGALPAITTTLYNLTNHPEEYAEIPQYEKDSNFVLVKGRNENGTVDYVTIPKGNVLPVIANPIQSFLEFVAGQNQQSLGEFATQFLSSTLPVVGDGQSLKEVAVKTIGSNLPQMVKPITENLINKSFYKYDTKKEDTKEIVPYYLKNKEPYEQSYEFTPTMYKGIGAVLNVSPLQVQNAMEGYLAGYSKIPAQIIEIAKNISEGEPVQPNQKTLLRRFVKQTYPTSGNDPKEETEKTPIMERLAGKASAAETTPQVKKSGDQYKVKIGKTTKYYDTEEEAKDALNKHNFKESGKNIETIDGKVYRRGRDGSVDTMSKLDYDTSLNSQKMQTAKSNEDYKTWLSLADKQLQKYEQQLQDPSLDELEQIEIQQKIEKLVEEAAKYDSYKGFKKPKKVSPGKPVQLKKVEVKTPAKVQFSTISLPTPKISLQSPKPKPKAKVRLRQLPKAKLRISKTYGQNR